MRDKMTRDALCSRSARTWLLVRLKERQRRREKVNGQSIETLGVFSESIMPGMVKDVKFGPEPG